MRRPVPALLSGGALLAAACAGALAWPAIAPAWLTEVGQIPTTTPKSEPSCPENPHCEVVARTTGFQVKVGTNTTLVTVPRNGRIVAWQIRLGNPSKEQIEYLEAHEGGPAEAALAILEPVLSTKAAPVKPDTFKLLAQSPLEKLEKYFGKPTQFPLASTIEVKKGDVIGLTVPTWAPALAIGFPGTTRWRASRTKEECGSTNVETAQTSVGTSTNFSCVYTTARLMYSATLVSTP